MNNDHPVITRIPYIETGAIYRGVVTHMRWAPVKHGFCYELAMIMVNLDVSRYYRDSSWVKQRRLGYPNGEQERDIYLGRENYIE